MTVRPPAVAGSFYPADPDQLRAQVDDLLDHAPGAGSHRAVVAPHAGYVYSGSTAAVAYHALRWDDVAQVAILGPTHRVPVRGIAAPQSTTWRTPLGDVAVTIPDAVAALPHVVRDERVHAPEHSLEVHVPFVQRLRPHATVTPLAVGRADEHEVAGVLDVLLADPATAVIISSDLSHYLPYADARRLDDQTLAQVTGLDGTITHEQACGATPVNGLMEHARRHGLALRTLASCSSGDTAGDRSRVVGYATLVLEDRP
ncbi:AmmeMemoRadiSam system protein B [Arsenicicoccus sp. oral taxon 190]|uniref:AmmeMemoRadiSam system protein B n=1 Tax=Arsenicicoccus sp. oral taxon 190 TaxID=1658671 RepID=UPI00067A13E0|nr:AmmeMemoRadiSam system protein B [Arsenicicoccus sp. oral taxon 190]AKT51862.1 hypothetical protein ADJ73_12320 [Arsenicicoccus sp. oral taxon 190]